MKGEFVEKARKDESRVGERFFIPDVSFALEEANIFFAFEMVEQRDKVWRMEKGEFKRLLQY